MLQKAILLEESPVSALWNGQDRRFEEGMGAGVVKTRRLEIVLSELVEFGIYLRVHRREKA
jgi:hypothetical protein